MADTAYQGWARLELMGHRQRVGFVREVEMFGGKLLRIDIPVAGSDDVTEFYGVTSIYAMTPITEELAREAAKRAGDPRPVRPMGFRLEDQTSDHLPESPDDENEYDEGDHR